MIEVLGDRVSVHLDLALIHEIRASDLLRTLAEGPERPGPLLDQLVRQLQLAGAELRAAEAIAVERRHEAAHRGQRGKG